MWFRIPTKLCSLALVMLLHPSGLQAGETIIWRVSDWAPMYILEGPDKGRGLYDELIALFERNMPEYQHLKVQMSTPRAFAQMANGHNVCHASVIRREAEGKAHISNLNSLLLVHQIIFRKDKRHLLGEENSVSLEALITNKSFRGGIASFGTHEFLKKYAKNRWQHLHYIPEQYDRLVKMLLLDRLDYIVQYPPVVSYMEKQLGKVGTTTSVFIKETRTEPYIRVYTACSKNRQGRAVIDKVNRILEREQRHGRLEEIQLRWFGDESRKLLKQAYQEEYQIIEE